MIQPPQLLEDLGVRWVICDDAFVGIFCTVVLEGRVRGTYAKMEPKKTYIFLLLVDVADLEPDISVSEGARRISENAIEAVEGFIVFPLLLVDYAETEQDLVGLVEI